MSHLVESDWVVSFLNGRPQAVVLFRGFIGQRVAISAITYGEVYEGLLANPVIAPRRVQFDGFMAGVELLVVDAGVARRYAELRSDLRPRGLLIPDNDIWIAATALAHDLTLVSRDQQFCRIPDLRLYRPGP